MHDALAMRAIERARDLNRHVDRLREGKRPAFETRGERLTFEVLHHQEVDRLLAVRRDAG